MEPNSRIGKRQKTNELPACQEMLQKSSANVDNLIRIKSQTYSVLECYMGLIAEGFKHVPENKKFNCSTKILELIEMIKNTCQMSKCPQT